MVCYWLGRPRVFSWVLLPDLLKAQFRKSFNYRKPFLLIMAIIEASGDLSPLQGVCKVKVLFCADATPIKACQFKLEIT